MKPETRYARSGDVHVAYQTLGDGPFDLVYVPGFVSNVEYGWEEPSRAAFLRRLASFSRLILFDKRGTGLSDRVEGVPTLEARMDDVRAVLEDLDSTRAAIMGVHEGGAMAALFAATYPQRTFALVLHGASVRGLRTDDYPWAPSAEEYRRDLEDIDRRWGSPDFCDELLRRLAPSMARDEEFRSWWGTYLRLSASPGAAAALHRMNMEIDLRHVLPTVRVPTLIVSRSRESPELRRYLASRIPDATEIELQGEDLAPYIGGGDELADAAHDFLAKVWAGRAWEEMESNRVLATVLFTDIVGSTTTAVALGDQRWHELLSAHHVAARRQLARFAGREVQMIGDGLLATFDGPARAIRCACAIVESMRELGLELRAGLHTGECELVDGDASGVAVHIGARVSAEAGAGEVLVSSTVKDLVAGSGLRFADRGAHVLKGVPGE